MHYALYNNTKTFLFDFLSIFYTIFYKKKSTISNSIFLLQYKSTKVYKSTKKVLNLRLKRVYFMKDRVLAEKPIKIAIAKRLKNKILIKCYPTILCQEIKTEYNFNYNIDKLFIIQLKP